MISMISLTNVVRKLGEKEIAVIPGDFNGYFGSNPENYEDHQHGGYGYVVRNKEDKSILEFCAAMKMTLGNTLFKKRASQLTHL